MKVKYWVVWLLIAAALLVPAPAGAQSKVGRLAGARVDLWPDFDRPAVLVLITAELSAEATLPAAVEFRLPLEAGEPTAVARINSEEEMLNTPYETRPGDGFTVLTVETTEPVVRVEYYYAYDRDGDEVRFAYSWLGGVAVDELVVLLREPDHATAVTTEAVFEDTGVGSDGRNYYEWQIGPVARDQTVSTQVSYAGALAVPAQASAGTATAGPVSEPLPLLLAAGGGLLAGGGIGWFVARRRSPNVPSRRPGRAARPAYCQQCGGRHKPGDQFCRQCGSRVS